MVNINNNFLVFIYNSSIHREPKKNITVFNQKFPVMKDGMKPEVTERRGWVWNPAKRDSDDRWFPL
jgi:hypothetical protein